MNSWDAGLPSQGVWELQRDADIASNRVEAARRSHADASEATRAFWAHVLIDRVEELRAIEAVIREERRTRLGTPDGLGLAADVMPLPGRPGSLGDP